MDRYKKRHTRHRKSCARSTARRRQLGYERLESRFLLSADASPWTVGSLPSAEGESDEPITISLQDGLNGYKGTRDTVIRGDQTTTNYGSKNKLELDGKPDQISLVRWDTTAIPSASTVIAASLTFNVIETSTEAFEIYEALRAWEEQTATYLAAANNESWGRAGASGPSDRGSNVLGAVTGQTKGLKSINLNTLGVEVVQKWITTPSTNFGIVIQDLADASTDDLDVSSREVGTTNLRPKLTITYVESPPAPEVTVNTLLTNDATPPLSGTVSDPAATISVTVNGQSRVALNHGNGTWTLNDNQLTALPQGVYDVMVTATAASGDPGNDSSTSELTIDLTGPSSTLTVPQDCHVYDLSGWTGSISGTASDLGGALVDSVFVSVQRLSDNLFWSGSAFDSSSPLLLDADGTTNWSIPLASSDLGNGNYEVTSHATDTAGNIGSVVTAKFTFDATPPPPPTVTIDPLLTNDSTPPLSGTVSSPAATISVTVAGQTKAAVNHGDGTWTLSDNALSSLASGLYDVVVTATAGSVGTDPTTDELTIDIDDPSTTLTFPQDRFHYRSATWTNSIVGSSHDTGGTTVDLVQVSIKRLSDGRYWSGASWNQTSEFFLSATGTTDWSLGFASANLTDGDLYTVSAQATDSAGNLSSRATATFTFDDTRPTVSSFTRLTPANNPTNADVLVFQVTFTESVDRVSAGDFAVTGTTATVTNVEDASASAYEVTVSGGDLSDLNGTVNLNLSSGQNIIDLAGNALLGNEPATDQSYEVDNTVSSAPIIVSLQDGVNGYQGTRDTSVRSDLPSSNFGSRTKMELDGNPDQVSLIRWDTTSIPSFSTVIAASVTLNVVTTSNDDYEFYEALRAWNELGATYVNADSGDPWDNPGVSGVLDRGADVLGVLTGRSAGPITVELNTLGIAMVQKWITDPASNFGIVIQDLNNATTDDLDISSRESSGPRPKLTVTYSEGPPPPPNDPPVADDDVYAANEDAALNVSEALGVLSNDTDPEGDPLSAIRVSGPAHGTLILNPDGSFVYTPAANFFGEDSFTYRADDGVSRGGSGVQTNVGTVTITVSGQADNPFAVDDSIKTTKNSSKSVNVLSNDSDPDGDSLTVFSHTQPSHGTLSRSGGTFTYTPNNNYTGTDSFNYTVRDATGRTASATVSIDVAAATSPVTFRAMGDVPYSSGEFGELEDDLANLGADDLFFMHVGDIKSGSSSCTASAYSSVANVLLQAEKTVFIIPGDNEWNDCSNPDQAWGFWESNFSRFDENWSDPFTVTRQAQRDENFAFVHDSVLFIGLNLVGGSVHDSGEWAERMQDNSQWVSDNFATYGDQVTTAVVFAHAFTDGARASFGEAFVEAAQDFAKPVLYLMGDKHTWKLDHPFSGAPNVTRVIVDSGVPSVRVTVTHDPDNPFQFDRTP